MEKWGWKAEEKLRVFWVSAAVATITRDVDLLPGLDVGLHSVLMAVI
ncbi:hypothetical protein MUK42_33413 [Musa troglodytarum]|uniref:Uncharacterized protein n=1 Tax=Musa troglodytarum TaxID=320322 RepID=A0A9E7FBW0_9LILI|nr:hypothetical protein MUK42_33413 [Musa troglodytarum]